jgi:hypothetical protein
LFDIFIDEWLDCMMPLSMACAMHQQCHAIVHLPQVETSHLANKWMQGISKAGWYFTQGG